MVGSAAAAAAAALLALAFAAGVLRLEPRGRSSGAGGLADIWLLTVFTGGVLALLFGVSAWLGQGITGKGAREGLAALRARMEGAPPGAEARLSEGADPGVAGAEKGEGGRMAPGGSGSVGAARVDPGWFLAVGGWLLLLYAAGWIRLG